MNSTTENYNNSIGSNTFQYEQSKVKFDNTEDLSVQGTVTVKNWKYKTNNGILTLTDYDDKSQRNIAIPNLNDFANTNVDVSRTNEVGINKNLISHILVENSNIKSLAVSIKCNRKVRQN